MSQNLLADDFIKNGPQQYMITGVSNLAKQSASDFSINFTRPLDCSQGNWNVSLVDLNVWNTYYNVSNTYGNTGFRWAVPLNADPHNPPVPPATPNYSPQVLSATLLPGSYNAPTLISDITSIITNYNYAGAGITLSATGAAMGVNLSINTAQLTFDLALGGQGFGFDPSSGGTSNLYRNMGAAKNVFYTYPGTSTINNPPGYTNTNYTYQPFPNQADISNGITSWQVRCSLVGTSYQNGAASDVLYNFLPSVAPGGAYAVQPAFPLKHQLNVKNITSVQFRITDQNGNVLNLQEGTDYNNNGTTIACMVSRA